MLIKKNFLKILLAITLLFGSYVVTFFIFPSLIVDYYRGEDGQTIWVKTKFLPLKKKISDTDKFKAPTLKWAPDKNHVAFYDMVAEKTFTREWALKIINPRIFSVRTIFIGDYKTSDFRWLDNHTIRVYASAGSGVRIYRDIDIDIKSPFVAEDHPTSEYWIAEKTF